MARLIRLGTSYAVVIPAPMRRDLKWWPSDELELQVVENVIVVANATQHDVTPVRRLKADEPTDDR